MNHLDSEQFRQNSILKPHSFLFAMQLKTRDLFHFLPCVPWFSNEVFNSSHHTKHMKTVCWASHSTLGILTQSRTVLLIHSTDAAFTPSRLSKRCDRCAVFISPESYSMEFWTKFIFLSSHWSYKISYLREVMA